MGRRRATTADIAARVGLTAITVSRALNRPELVKPETRERIRAAARELGYVPNAFARGLRHRRSRLIGFVTASVDNPFYAEMIKAVSRHAKRHNYAILLFDTDGEPWLEANAIQTLLSYQAAGIILSPVSDEPAYQPDYVNPLADSDVAVVQLDRLLAGAGFDAVVLDNHWAGARIARHLRERTLAGDTTDSRLLAVAGPEQSVITRQRLAGLRAGLGDYAGAIDVLWGDYTLAPARAQVGDYLDTRGAPRAILGLNQLITLGALSALRERGLSSDVAGIDRLPYLDLFDIRVPSVVHDGRSAGRQALDLLLARIADPGYPPRTITVRGELRR